MLRIGAIVPALCALSIAACGGGGGGSPTSPTGGNNGPTNPGNPNPVTSNAVTLTPDSFKPANITVPKGTVVTWNWDSCSTTGDGYGGYGTTCVAHNITFDDGRSSSLQSSGSFTRLFDVAGTFKYHCAVHGTAMSGQVVVQ
jgi:plastocyanin